jgi:hypothetical protein
MIITKTIQTKVHIEDTVLLYSGDIDSVIMDNLKQRFEGYCFMSCLIMEVLEIQQRSNFVFSRQRQDGSVSCNVRVKVKGIVIKKKEILHNCVVKKIDKDGHIICKNDYSAVYIRASETLQTIKQDQIIVALAGNVCYNIFKPAISVNALPFIPIHDNLSKTIYNVVVDNTNNIINTMVTDIEKELKKNKAVEELDKDVYKFFIDLLYPYSTKKIITESKIPTITMSSIVNIDNNTKLTISQPDWLPKDKPIILSHGLVQSKDLIGTNELQETDDGIIITETYCNVVGYMIHKHIEHLSTIRQLCTTYNTMELIQKNNNLWDIYIKGRIR